MNVYIRAPMFTRAGLPTLTERIEKFQSWNAQQSASLKKEFSTGLDVRIIAPTLSLAFSDGVKIHFPANYDALVPKGFCIRLELLSILYEIDSLGVGGRDNSYFIQIDGSGAFDYESIRRILQSFGHRYAVVLGLRNPESSWGMEAGRKQIELFEMFLLQRKYAKQILANLQTPELPDAQAGCWGIHLGNAKDLSLTARTYGLEFDVIASTLAADLPFTFARVLLAETQRVSEHRLDDSVEKMKFICHKLGYTAEEVVELLGEYQQQHEADPNRRLSPKYVDKIRALAPKVVRTSDFGQ